MSHDHNHAQANYGRAFAIGITLNLAFVVVEAFYGWQAESLALLADAAHNLSDVGGLLLAWAAFAAARLKPNARHTYGWRRGSILASFTNSVILLVAMGSLAWEAIHRFQTPASIDATTVILVAGVGVVINSVTAWLFLTGSKGDLNIRAMSTAENALTAHLVIENDSVDRDGVLQQAIATLHERFELRHVSLQCESQAFASRCSLNKAD